VLCCLDYSPPPPLSLSSSLPLSVLLPPLFPGLQVGKLCFSTVSVPVYVRWSEEAKLCMIVFSLNSAVAARVAIVTLSLDRCSSVRLLSVTARMQLYHPAVCLCRVVNRRLRRCVFSVGVDCVSVTDVCAAACVVHWCRTRRSCEDEVSYRVASVFDSLSSFRLLSRLSSETSETQQCSDTIHLLTTNNS